MKYACGNYLEIVGLGLFNNIGQGALPQDQFDESFFFVNTQEIMECRIADIGVNQ